MNQPLGSQSRECINDIIKQQVLSAIDEGCISSFENVFDIAKRVQTDFNYNLEENQIETVEVINDVNNRYINLIAARSGGKTSSVVVGKTVQSIDVPGLSIGLTAPREEQAGRLITELRTKLLPKSSYLKDQIQGTPTGLKVFFKNGSSWQAFSANEMANNEGLHFDVLICDEAQGISDFSMSQILLPMIAHSKHPQLIKLGVPLYRNHFFKGFNNPGYVSLKYDWLHCPLLLRGGYKEIDKIKYPLFCLSRMPLSKKMIYFPNNPELWTEGDMSEEDFATQFEMQWISDINLFLNEDDQIRLIGNHVGLESGFGNEDYFFGLDIAGGEMIAEKNCRTALSVWVKREGGVKQKVKEWNWQGDLTGQFSEILDAVHPDYGKFRCKFGYGDYGYTGPAMIDFLKKSGLPIEGIMFGSRDPESGYNYKNAMYNHFQFELRSGRAKYPSREFIDKSKIFKRGYNQWCGLERRGSLGINAKIDPPSGEYSDSPCSDILCTFALDKKKPSDIKKATKFKWPRILQGTPTVHTGDEEESRSGNTLSGNNGFFGSSSRKILGR